MDNLAVLVSREGAKAAIETISAYGKLDCQRRVQTRKGFVEIPIIDYLPGFHIICQEKPEHFRKAPQLTELMNGLLEDDQLALLPRGWYILGNIIIVKIQPQLEQFKHQIGDALLTIYPRCQSVLRDFGIEGELREPVREIIAGETTETVHRENGVLFKLDAQKIMFSMGNLRERIRMSRLGRDEVVVDMFAGIGYFTIPMAVHARPRKILAIELNPVAHRYLKENVRLNHVESIVNIMLGDCRELTPHGLADRVVMGYVGATDRYLKNGILALRPGGMLHYHQTVPSWQYPQSVIKDVVAATEALGRSAEIMGCARVKKYSPGVVHAVVDACIGRDS